MSNSSAGTLRLVALSPIAAKEMVTFCYCDLDEGKRDLLHEEFYSRRERLQRELGFICRCVACVKQEAACARNPQVFLDVAIDGRPAGRIQLTLRADVAPRTCENFRCLCTGERGASAASGRLLSYRGTTLHRIIPRWCVQGGAGGESIYGGKFDDETFALRHTKAGVLSMANSGPHSNGSGFFITCDAAPSNDGRHVAFGEVSQGMDVVRAVEAYGSEAGATTVPITISDCGEFTSVLNDYA